MMILSRIWYVILAILLAAAYYIVSLAVGQYNRRNAAAMDETLKADSQVVELGDAGRRAASPRRRCSSRPSIPGSARR